MTYDELVKLIVRMGFIEVPTEEQFNKMSGMTLNQAYAAWCDYMAGFDLDESIEANKE